MARSKAGLLRKRWAKPFIAFIIAAAVVSATVIVFPIGSAPEDALSAYLDTRIPAIMDAYDIPGTCVALIDDGAPVWSKAYGYADVGAGRKMTTDDYMRVQSISKSVTAWGVMTLAEQGRIDLDAPASRYLESWTLPDSPYPNDITVRQLLTHTAGLDIGNFLVRYDPRGDVPPLRESLSGDVKYMREPGAAFAYSNTGYNMLELLIEDVTGRDFAEYMQQEIMRPLGMADATFEWNADFSPPVPYGYGTDGEAVPVYVYPEKGSGGLFATVDDIAAFAAAGMKGSGQTVVNEQSVGAIYSPAADDLGMYSLAYDAYGFGHYIETLPDGAYAVAHGGQGTGWMTHFQSVPNTGDGIVILTNSQRSWPMISYIIGDWARWCSLPNAGMGRIALCVYAMWVLIFLVWLFALWQALRIIVGVIERQRCFAPLSRHRRGRRIAVLIIAAVISVTLIWCAAQDYLLITSIFPVAAVHLAISGIAAAAVLLMSALLPEKAPA